MGHLDVTFDEEGRLMEWDGNPILLDKYVEEGTYKKLTNIPIDIFKSIFIREKTKTNLH